MYDPRLGRWLSIDPKSRKYPMYSPYNSFDNNPIFFADPNGEDGIGVVQKNANGVGGTITIKAVYYAQSVPTEGVYPMFTTKYTEKDIKNLNEKVNTSLNNANYVVSEGEYAGYNVKFDIQIIPAGSENEARNKAANEKMDNLPIGNVLLKTNEKTRPDLFAKKTNEKGETTQVKGVTEDHKTILMESSSNFRDKLHEIFQTLFVDKDNAESGIGNYTPGTDMPNQQDINDLINNKDLPKVEKK